MPTRRELLTGQGIQDAEANPSAPELPLSVLGDTLRLSTPAMASDFEVILNPGSGALLDAASAALEVVHQLEDQYSIYRPHTELTLLNARGATEPVPVERRLFELLRRAVNFARATDGAFDPTAGPLVALWRICRKEKRLPTEQELAEAQSLVGCRFVEFDERTHSIGFSQLGVTLNLNAMGKGYALDRAAELMDQRPNETVDGRDNWLMHGGYSSILARGKHAGCDGWPVGIRHPLFPNRQLATVLLKNRAMSTSGSVVQFFRYQGKRYGHLIDPRTGWPVDSMLAVTVLAPDAAQAEALSTAFFVMGVEKAREYCHNYQHVTALLIAAPVGGSRLDPVVCGIPDSELVFVPDV
jgi:thiamine biosynthesis lipoprotein